jgi:hypothetical protein
VDTVLLCDNLVIHAVVEFSATIDGNRLSVSGSNGCDEFDWWLLHP